MQYSRLSFVLSLCVVALSGCQQNTAWRQQQAEWQQQQQAQIAEFQRRATGLDVNNRDLHTQLAQAEQQSKILQEEVSLLKKQLTDSGTQLAQSQKRISEAEKKVQAMTASTTYRGGAAIKPNNSISADLSQLDIPGVFARQDGDVIRIEIPADNLFAPGTNSLQPNSEGLLSQVTSYIGRQFPGNKIGIEGHTDNQPVNPPYNSHHQLSASMAQAIVDQLAGRYRIDPSRLSVVGHGANRPIVSNATQSGQQRNRRIDLVIYPDGGQ